MMIKELYRFETTETSLNVTQSEIDSVRRKHIVKSGCRVYDGTSIGIAGTLGEATAETWRQAEANLERKVPYPYAPEQNKTRREDRRQEILDSGEFTARVERLLDRLRTAFPRMIFSNKVNMSETTVSLTNDAGLDYCCRDLTYTVMLLAKDVDSAAVFDTAAEYLGRSFDVDAIFADVSQIMEAHQTVVPLPEGNTLPLIVESGLVKDPLNQALNGQLFHRGASLLSGKQGQKLFSEDVTLQVDRTPDSYAAAFFDAEGSVLPGDQLPLIENGVLARPYADKKTAAEFSCENTAAAGANYDDLPQLAAPNTSFASSGKSLRELLQGRDAALVVMASGGDCTPDGMLATPVQTSYLYRDGKLLGKLPEFSARGSLFDLLGKYYLGRSDDKPFCGFQWLAVEAEITP